MITKSTAAKEAMKLASAKYSLNVQPVQNAVRTHTGISRKNKSAVQMMAARTGVPQAAIIDALITKGLATTKRWR